MQKLKTKGKDSTLSGNDFILLMQVIISLYQIQVLAYKYLLKSYCMKGPDKQQLVKVEANFQTSEA